MRTSSLPLLVAATAAALSACYDGKPVDVGGDAELGTFIEDLKVEDCATLTAAFSEPKDCPKPKDLTDDQKKKKCSDVKAVALNDYKRQFGKDPDCSEGWVFGPTPLLDACIKDSGKNLCKLAATNPKPPDTGWPASSNWSKCLNDWVVYCTDTFPAEMGIKANPKGQVCFHKDLDYGRLGADSVTAREVCQRLKDGTPKTFPDKCPDELCKPKKKPETKKKNPTACLQSATDHTPSGEEPPCDPETWTCQDCDPETDPDCEYDVGCGCQTCEPGDDDPMCSEDLACPSPSPTPTPSPTPMPTPPPPSPTPYPTPYPTPPPPTPTPFPTPMPTPPPPTPFPTPMPTPPPPSPTPFPTPMPTPPPPSPTPFPTPMPTPLPPVSLPFPLPMPAPTQLPF